MKKSTLAILIGVASIVAGAATAYCIQKRRTQDDHEDMLSDIGKELEAGFEGVPATKESFTETVTETEDKVLKDLLTIAREQGVFSIRANDQYFCSGCGTELPNHRHEPFPECPNCRKPIYWFGNLNSLGDADANVFADASAEGYAVKEQYKPFICDEAEKAIAGILSPYRKTESNTEPVWKTASELAEEWFGNMRNYNPIITSIKHMDKAFKAEHITIRKKGYNSVQHLDEEAVQWVYNDLHERGYGKLFAKEGES